jgi:hypothetical protein
VSLNDEISTCRLFPKQEISLALVQKRQRFHLPSELKTPDPRTLDIAFLNLSPVSIELFKMYHDWGYDRITFDIILKVSR